MDIRRLEAFCKVYELGSFSLAGKRLYLSQPTISAHVSSLENELGLKLFDRLGRTILPTEAGNVLYKYATEAFSVLDNARAEIQMLQDKVVGQLSVGGSTIPAHYLLPQELAGFSAMHPEVHVELRVGDTEKIVEMITAGKLSVGIVGARIERVELEYTPFVEDEVQIIAPAGWPSDRRSLTDQNCLSQWPWVVRESGSGTRYNFELALSRAGMDSGSINDVIEADSTQSVLQCVSAGMGAGYVSSIAAADSIASGKVVKIQADNLKLGRQFYMVRHAKRNLLPVVRHFIDYLTRNEELKAANA